MKSIIITESGYVEVDDSTFDSDARSFFNDQKEKGQTLPIEFRYSFDKLVKNIKRSAQSASNFTLIVWNIGRDDMPEGNEPNDDGLLYTIKDVRLKGRKIEKIEIAGAQIYDLFHHNESDPNDDELNITDLGGARVGEYVVAYLQ